MNESTTITIDNIAKLIKGIAKAEYQRGYVAGLEEKRLTDKYWGKDKEDKTELNNIIKNAQGSIENRINAAYNLGKKEGMSKWIPVKERLPKRAEGGASNWHTDTVIVCMYGNAQYDGYEDFDYEILTGIFVELEDAETGKKELCFEPDRFTLFIPDNWDFFPLDENFETHLPKNECMFLVDDYSDKTEFHDKYFKVLAWIPLPEPYREDGTE